MTTTMPAQRRGLLSTFPGRDPFRALQEQMDDLIARFESDWNGESGLRTATPSLDLSESEDALEVRTDMPGIKPEDIDIEVTGNTLRISGERNEESEEKGKTFHRIERRHGTFARAITLPCDVDAEKIEAQSNDGVLTVTLPKTEPAKTKKIKVKT